MPLDEADIKKIAEIVGAQIKANNEAQADVVVKVVGEQLKPITARLDAADTEIKKVAKAPPKAEEPDPKKPKDDKAVDPATAKLQEEVEKLQASLKAKDDEAKAAADKAKADALVNHAREALGDAGVPSHLIVPALALIKDQGILAYEGDKAGFRYQRKGYAEVVSGKAGAEEWLKTDAGKLYLPPSDARGNGDRGGKSPDTRAAGVPVSEADLTRSLVGKLLAG